MPVTPSALRLSELLAARLCHDLASSVGVLAGLLEMAAEATDPAVLAAARAASVGLVRQLRLFRAAWAIDPGSLSVAGLEALTEGMGKTGRLRLDFSGLARQPNFPPAAGRLVLNLLLLGGEALRGQGELHLSGAPDGQVALRIAGPAAAWPTGMAACLLQPEMAWAQLADPRTIQMPLTVLLAAQAGLRLSMLLPMTAAMTAPPPVLLQIA